MSNSQEQEIKGEDARLLPPDRWHEAVRRQCSGMVYPGTDAFCAVGFTHRPSGVEFHLLSVREAPENFPFPKGIFVVVPYPPEVFTKNEETICGTLAQVLSRILEHSGAQNITAELPQSVTQAIEVPQQTEANLANAFSLVITGALFRGGVVLRVDPALPSQVEEIVQGFDRGETRLTFYPR